MGGLLTYRGERIEQCSGSMVPERDFALPSTLQVGTEDRTCYLHVPSWVVHISSLLAQSWPGGGGGVGGGGGEGRGRGREWEELENITYEVF